MEESTIMLNSYVGYEGIVSTWINLLKLSSLTVASTIRAIFNVLSSSYLGSLPFLLVNYASRFQMKSTPVRMLIFDWMYVVFHPPASMFNNGGIHARTGTGKDFHRPWDSVCWHDYCNTTFGLSWTRRRASCARVTADSVDWHD